MTGHELDALAKISITLARVDERTSAIKDRLDDHLDHHDNTRQIITEEISRCQTSHTARGGVTTRGTVAIITAVLLGLGGAVAAVVQALG